MPAKSETLVHQWFEEVWNQGKAEAIDRLLAPRAVVHGITDANGKEVRGPKGFREFHQIFLSAFPNIKIKVLDTIVAGDKIAARCIVQGKHTGEGLGFKATGKKVEITGMCIARIKDGKIVEAWNNFDFLTLYKQLDSLSFLA